MTSDNVIHGTTEDEVWQQINTQLLADPDLLEYSVLIEQEDKQIFLAIDIDLGGGFESGYETTTFSAPLHAWPDFKFALHAQHFTDEIGKFFGMQDVVIGYEEFDKNFIIKTNEGDKVRALFADPEVRSVLLSLNDFSFGIHTHHLEDSHKKGPFLELLIDAGITDPTRLRQLYHAFFTVLQAVDKPGVQSV